MDGRGLVSAIIFVAVALAVGAIGGLATADSVATWYATLAKPSFNPPNFVFGPVWTALYILMALAAWRVWRRAGFQGAGRRAQLLYAAQLALNLGWSLIFFGLRAPTAAMAEIVLLWLAIVGTMITFARVDRTAALMLVPYLAWVTFAATLNFEIVRLN